MYIHTDTVNPSQILAVKKLVNLSTKLIRVVTDFLIRVNQLEVYLV